MPQDDTTQHQGFNLPGIGITTDWATQYHQNWQQLDGILQGFEQVYAMKMARIKGPVTGDGSDGNIHNLSGQNLSIDADGNLNAEESTGTTAVVAQSRRRVNTPVGGA